MRRRRWCSSAPREPRRRKGRRKPATMPPLRRRLFALPPRCVFTVRSPSSRTRRAPAARQSRKGLRQLVASGPFLRALRRAVPGETWDAIQSWSDESGATPEQSAARHQRLLRDLPAATQGRLEALCCFEALDLFRKARAHRTSARLIAAIAAL